MKLFVWVIIVAIIIFGILFLIFLGSEPKNYDSVEIIPDGLSQEQYDKVLVAHYDCMSDISEEISFNWGGSIGIVKSGGSEHCYKLRQTMIDDFRKQNIP